MGHTRARNLTVRGTLMITTRVTAELSLLATTMKGRGESDTMGMNQGPTIMLLPWKITTPALSLPTVFPLGLAVRLRPTIGAMSLIDVMLVIAEGENCLSEM